MSRVDAFLPSNHTAYRNRDRLLPSQVFMRQFYIGDDFDGRLEAITTSVLQVRSVHEKFHVKLKPGMSYETLGSDLSTLHFLQLLVRLTGAREVLEIGTYVGVSTMFLAEAVGLDGRIVTVEKGEEFATIAADNFMRNGLADRIGLVNMGAAKFASTCRPQAFDMIFLDGAKADYATLLQPLLALLRPGGLMLVDDVFCQGDALNPEPITDKGRGVRDMLKHVAVLGLSPVILPYGDGLLLLRKP